MTWKKVLCKYLEPAGSCSMNGSNQNVMIFWYQCWSNAMLTSMTQLIRISLNRELVFFYKKWKTEKNAIDKQCKHTHTQIIGFPRKNVQFFEILSFPFMSAWNGSKREKIIIAKNTITHEFFSSFLRPLVWRFWVEVFLYAVI